MKTWKPGLTAAEERDIAYWERNMLALRYADGWYNDYVQLPAGGFAPRYEGWGRVLTLDGGRMTFHIPDDFDVGNLPQVHPNWDGHTTEEKWKSVLRFRGAE